MMWLGVMLACTLGAMALSDGNTNSIIKDNKKDFKYNEDYCRKNLKHYYFNNSDCSTISSQLERDKMLVAELDYLQRSNSFDDSVQQLINRGKITL